jgi:hypothetical protein
MAAGQASGETTAHKGASTERTTQADPRLLAAHTTRNNPETAAEHKLATGPRTATDHMTAADHKAVADRRIAGGLRIAAGRKTAADPKIAVERTVAGEPDRMIANSHTTMNRARSAAAVGRTEGKRLVRTRNTLKNSHNTLSCLLLHNQSPQK